MNSDSHAMTCACGKTATYRVGELGYCSTHRLSAVQQIAKFGNPRTRKTKPKPSTVVLIHVDKPSRKEAKELFRQNLKKNPTPAEVKLRDLLKSHPATKGQYEFQPLLQGYIPDFLNRKAKLIIEADGWHHYTTSGRRADARRTNALNFKGFHVLRFANKQILDDPQFVLDSINLVQSARLNLMPGGVTKVNIPTQPEEVSE